MSITASLTTGITQALTSGITFSGFGVPNLDFNDGVSASGGLSYTHTRPWAITSAARGTIAAIDTPAFYDTQVIAGAPNVTPIYTDSLSLTTPFSGYWTDGTTKCDIIWKNITAPASAYVDIYLGAAVSSGIYQSAPSSRRVDVRCQAGDLGGNKTTNQLDLLRGTPDESATRCYQPVGFTIVQGLILALCSYFDWTGSAWENRGISLCQWDEPNLRWKRIFDTNNTNNGCSRSREWTTNQYFIADGAATLQQSKLVYVAYTDYQFNGGSPNGKGGQVIVVKLTRATTADAWAIANTATDAAMVVEQFISGSTNVHLHDAFVYRDTRLGANGLVLAVLRGDSTQAELQCWTRTDDNIGEGWDTVTKVATASMTHGATSNGWTTYRQVAGLPSELNPSAPPPPVGWLQGVVAAQHPTEPYSFILSNDEGLNPAIKMTMPNFAAGETHAKFDIIENPVFPNTIKRGVVSLGVWNNTANKTNYLLVPKTNSNQSGSLGAKNEIQRLTFVPGGSPSGTFTVTFNGQTTGAITYSTTPATLSSNIQTAILALSNVGSGNAAVSNPVTNGHDVTFQGTLASAGQPLMTVNGAGLTQCTVSVARMQPGNGNILYTSYNPVSGSKPQGFTSTGVLLAKTRMLGSYDGEYFFTMGAPNTDSRPAVSPDGYAYIGGTVSYGKVNAYKFPTIIKAKPMRLSPGTTNYQISNVTLASAASGGNTFASVNVSTALGVADGVVTGRTIPKPPCNGPVFRWTCTNAVQNGGQYTLTTSTPVTASPNQKFIKARLWLYMLPPSVPYGGDTVAPFNSGRTSFRSRLLRAASGQSQFSGTADFDSVDGGGWVPFVISTNTEEWSSYVTNNVNLAIQFTNQTGVATNSDILVAFDTVQISATPDDLCVHPGPVSTSASAQGSDYFAINVNATAEKWTALFVGRTPPGGWDQYMFATHRPDARLFTINSFFGVWAKADVVNRRIVMEDFSGSTSLGPTTGEEMVFEPGADILIAMTADGTNMRFAASVAGTQVNLATHTLAAPITPDQIILADDGGQGPIAAMDWFRVQFKDNVFYNDAQLTSALQNLTL